MILMVKIRRSSTTATTMCDGEQLESASHFTSPLIQGSTRGEVRGSKLSQYSRVGSDAGVVTGSTVASGRSGSSGWVGTWGCSGWRDRAPTIRI